MIQHLSLSLDKKEVLELGIDWWVDVKDVDDMVYLLGYDSDEGNYIVVVMDKEYMVKGKIVVEDDDEIVDVVGIDVDGSGGIYVGCNVGGWGTLLGRIKKYVKDKSEFKLVNQVDLPLYRVPYNFPLIWSLRDIIEVNGQWYICSVLRDLTYRDGGVICVFDRDIIFDDWEELIRMKQEGEIDYLGLSSRGVGIIKYDKDLNIKCEEMILNDDYEGWDLLCPVDEYGEDIVFDTLGNKYVSGYRWVLAEDDYFVVNLDTKEEYYIMSNLEEYEHHIDMVASNNGVFIGYNSGYGYYGYTVEGISSTLVCKWSRSDVYGVMSVDSKGDLWLGYSEEPDWYPKLLKIRGEDGEIVWGYEYKDGGRGVDLLWIDKQDKLNLISWLEEGKWLITRFILYMYDTIPPAKIKDLALLDCSVTAKSVTLTWTAVGDDGNIGQASRYDIRYSTQSILTDEDFDKATQVEVELQPKPSGEKETLTVVGLQQGTEYYFAIKVIDDANNISELSNCVFARTLLDVPYFCQADPQWRDIPHLRPRDVQTENTIGKVGCALTSMAMIINYYADYHPDENMRNKIVKRNPLELNDLLVETSWYYVDSHDVDFSKISFCTDHAVVYGGRQRRRNDIMLNEELKQKRPTILVVSYIHPETNDRKTHYVVAIGSCTTTYKINDPGRRGVKTLMDKFTLPGTATPTSYENSYDDVIRFLPGPCDESSIFIDGWQP
jgi:hypothetical protein